MSIDDIPIQTEDGEGIGLMAISEEKEDDEKVSSRCAANKTRESAASSALAGVKNLPKTISGLGKKVKESKVGQKTSTQFLEKEKMEKKNEKDGDKETVKYLKEDVAVSIQPGDEIEFKRIDRIITADKDKVSLVSDSLKANDVLDSVASNGATKIDSYSEVISHNAVHVSSV